MSMRGSLTQLGTQELDRTKEVINPAGGLRTGRWRLYDSVNGKTCHWCRQKTVEDHVQCSLCVIRFCSLCLKNRHGEDILLEMQEGNAWVCPKCRDGCGPGCNKCCNCGPCRKVQGLECTGMIVHLARAAGFTNVHDYLIFKTTGESPLEIARRKVGRGWCRSVDYLLLALEKFGPTTQSSALIQGITREQLETTSEMFHSSNTNVGTEISPPAATSGEDTFSKWDNRQGHIEMHESTQACPTQQQNRKDTQQQNRKDTQQQNRKDSPSNSASSQGHGFIRKRNTEPGVRVIGCRIYDSVNGETCHWCRQKTLEDHVHCSYCTNKFCGLCLKNRHGEEIMLEIQEGNAWVCPKCRNGCGPGCKQCCNCGPCRKLQGLEATGMVVHLARSAGFTNVHDYLIFKTTGESPREISRRKIGRGWCRSADHYWSRPEEFGRASQSSLVTDSTREYTRMRGSMSKEQVKQLPASYSYLLPKNYCTEDKFVKVSTVGNTDCRGIPFCILSDDFKKNLMATLQEPFSTQELHEMWNIVNHRKPIVRLRHTRQRTVQVETKEEGFSYLDYHPDLAKSIAAATAPEEKLSLLRGFFFWLKHASWPGAFQPWVSSLARKENTNIDDDECVEMDGPDCEVVAVLLSVDDRQTTTSFPGKRQLLHPPLIKVKKEKFQTQEDTGKFLSSTYIEVKEEIATY